jgi:Rps23 Pro-64 3,4-dihydroxylase Tpa1-like proline 4-hydroxylase
MLTRFAIRRDFLPLDAVADLFAFALEKQAAFTPSVVGLDGAVDRTRRISSVLHDLGPLKDIVRGRLAAVLPEVLAELRISPFTPSRIEVELAAHNDGAFFATHIDTQLEAGMADMRQLSGVYYFHSLPQRFAGGQLRFHEIGGTEERLVDVEPAHNTIVFFPSWMPHEVLPVSCPSRNFADSRFAINFWYRGAY